MRFIPRQLAAELRSAAKAFSALIVTGPRRAGKTTLLHKVFPKADYVLLEDPDIISRFRADPRSFIEELRPPVNRTTHHPRPRRHLEPIACR
jgi:predicted AAA+ superfamily ATPase